MYRITKTLILSFIMTVALMYGNIFSITTTEPVSAQTIVISTPTKTLQPVSKKVISPVLKPKPKMSVKDIELIALVTMAEAEGESEKGKRLVIDTILNRVKSPNFPNTIYNVIYQPNQFTSMWTKRVTRCRVQDDICKLVEEELESQVNYDAVFFTAGHYSKYGVPMFKVGNHYFSKYK